MHGAAAFPGPDSGVENRRPDLGLHLLLVELYRVVIVLPVKLVILFDRIQTLVADRHLHFPAPLDIAIDVVTLDRGAESIHVFTTQAFQFGYLVRKHALRVIDTVHDGCGHDGCGTPAGPVGDGTRLDQHHVTLRLLLLGLDRGPQSAKPAAHDQQVALDIQFQRRQVLITWQAVQPVGVEGRLR